MERQQIDPRDTIRRQQRAARERAAKENADHAAADVDERARKARQGARAAIKDADLFLEQTAA